VWSGGGGGGGYGSRGRYSADYLTVEHDSGLDLPDQLVLRRRTDGGESNASRRQKYAGGPRRAPHAAAFHVQRLDQDDDDDDDDVIAVHEISRNIFVASTQFERPFDYSTSTWSVSTALRSLLNYQHLLYMPHP